MDPATLKADAATAVLVACAFDMFKPDILAPTPDPRLSPAWIIRGYITAMDAVLPKLGPLQLGSKAYYGFLAESTVAPGRFVAAIRGTADMAEWAIDADFRQVPHAAGGMVEEVFWGLYQTMRYQPLVPIGVPDSPLAPGLARAVGLGHITVLGHSLGAALATLATLDMSSVHGMGPSVRGLFIASPRVGNEAFADAFATHVNEAIGYALEGDLVPQVPEAFGYTPVHCTQVIGPSVAQAIIQNSRACKHHIYSYLSSMDWSLMNWNAVPSIDRNLTACILGPS